MNLKFKLKYFISIVTILTKKYNKKILNELVAGSGFFLTFTYLDIQLYIYCQFKSDL